MRAVAEDFDASMRPQHLCCGNRRRVPAGNRQGSRRFNEAAAPVLRKPAAAHVRTVIDWAASMRPPRILRFNEAAAPVLRKQKALVNSAGAPRRASMRPQHLCCGNRSKLSSENEKVIKY
jgi:hypothetical protein